ncbi:MAG: oligosaccharide repeat unit polymerase [Armatimonadetes bacterium]|nr:oligosaccharide repeat unit polymerase [Armatimonadota bacterium]
MFRKLDADIVITIFVLPLALVAFLLIKDEEISRFGSFLTLALFLYEIIIFDKRAIYGFSGLRIISFPSLIILIFTVFIAIPSVYIVNIKTHPAKYNYFISILFFYILFPLGLLLGDLIKKIDVKKVKEIKYLEFTKGKYDILFYKVLLFLFSFCLLIIFLYLARSKVYPLFEMIKNPGSYAKLQLMREQALKILPVTFIEKYLFSWLRSLFIPFGIVGSLFLSLVYKKRKYITLFLLFFSFGMLANLITLEKSPSAAIFLVIVSLFFLRLKNLTIKFILTSVVMIFSFPILIMYFLHFGKENIFKVLYISLLNRIFIVPSETLFQYFKIFPQTHDFLLGRATHFFSWLHDQGLFPISNYVARTWWESPKTTGLANTTFIGNFWADFGWLGVLLSIFIVGIIIHLFYWKILTVSEYRKNIIFTTIIASTVPIFTFGFFSSNFTTLFFTRGLILVIIFLFILSFKFSKYK